MRVLVTGGTGFIGSNIVKALLARGDEVVMTGSDAEVRIPEFHGVYLQPGLIGMDWERVGTVDALVHEAAINDTTSLDEREMFRANVDASKVLFEYVVKNGCTKIVYASSTAVYGDAPAPYREGVTPLRPLNPYARSKKALEDVAAELHAQHPEVGVIGLRYCNVYGPGEAHKGRRASMIFQLAQQMKVGNPRIFKQGEQKRDYIYVDDVVRANLLSLESSWSGVVNCGSGKAASFNEVVELLNGALRTNRRPEYIENPYAKRYQVYTECDMALAKEKIGFIPSFDVERGIAEYCKRGL
ncbi:MAG: NAD-dependent epimerase/dehydratase family protein [Candidatus Liptonbacteria bacterium]|nr:NAD-dependent epimerase/dehydratase family protein [Candidatus Liptonbacteria bacterium]